MMTVIDLALCSHWAEATAIPDADCSLNSNSTTASPSWLIRHCCRRVLVGNPQFCCMSAILSSSPWFPFSLANRVAYVLIYRHFVDRSFAVHNTNSAPISDWQQPQTYLHTARSCAPPTNTQLDRQWFHRPISNVVHGKTDCGPKRFTVIILILQFLTLCSMTLRSSLDACHNVYLRALNLASKLNLLQQKFCSWSSVTYLVPPNKNHLIWTMQFPKTYLLTRVILYAEISAHLKV